MSSNWTVAGSSRTRRKPNGESSRWRAPGALLTNATSSVGNFSISIAVAHTGGLGELGQYGVAVAIYVLATGMVRTAVADTVLGQVHSHELNRRSLRRVVLLGLVAAGLVCGASLMLSQPLILLLGCALPGIVVYDFVKVVNLGTGTVLRAMAQETAWSSVILVFAVLGLTHLLDTNAIFAGWVFSCAVIGIVHAMLLRYTPLPGWNVDRDETKVSLTFALDFLAGSGIAQITTMLVAAAAGVTVAGALRGAGTILAPLTIISGTLPSLLIPYLARARRISTENAARAARRVVLVATAAAVPVIVGLLAIPSRFGHVLLSGNWGPSRAVLPMIAGELLFTILAAIPFAGHRVERAGARALTIRAVRAPFQVGAIVASAVVFGAKGAAWAMAAMSLIGALTWWVSYRRLLRGAVAPASDIAEPPLFGDDDWYASPRETPLRSPQGGARRIAPTRRRPKPPLRKPIRSARPPRTQQRKRDSIVQLFPGTTFVLAAYVGLILPIAIIKGNAQLAFIFRVLGVAVLGCLFAEGVALPYRMRRPTTLVRSINPVDLKRITVAVTAIALVQRVLFTLSGGGSVATQLAGTRSSLATVLSVLSAWNLFAVGLLFACHLREICGRRFLLCGLGSLIVVEFWAALSTGIIAPLAQFLTTVLLMALVLRLMRLRSLVIALVIVLLGWPTVFQLRNASRQAVGVQVDSRVGAWDRLRLDEQLTRVTDFEDQIPVNLGQPGLLDTLRYGLVPRFLDSSRASISSASLISVAVGGTSTSAYNFLSIGTIYFFYGLGGLVVFYLFAALLFTFIIGRAVRAGPLALCMATLAAQDLFGPVDTFPDAVIALLQAAVSFIPIALVWAARSKQHEPSIGASVTIRRRPRPGKTRIMSTAPEMLGVDPST